MCFSFHGRSSYHISKRLMFTFPRLGQHPGVPLLSRWNRDFSCIVPPDHEMVVHLFFAVIFWVYPIQGFEVYWNVPSEQCLRHNIHLVPLLRQYGILANDGDRFQGEKITIFYESKLGLYPKFDNVGKEINGGIPQLGDLDAHMKQSKEDVQRIIPDEDWRGVGIIDWEAWRPTWEFNWGSMAKYRERSINLMKDKYPKGSKDSVETLAKEEWENSTKSWMLGTLELSKKLRPKGLWGFYLFPDCYNYEGNSPKEFQCSDAVKKGNDKLKWLWEASTALFPSLYVYDSHLDRYDLRQRTWYIHGRLQEAQRVASFNAKIFPYVCYGLKPEKKVPEAEFWRVMSQIASSGSDGAIIWGSSASVGSKSLCQELKDYIIKVLGPASEKIAWNARRCSESVCHGKGRCTWPNDTNVTAWSHLAAKEDKDFYAADIQCQCFGGYRGRFCESRNN